MIRFKNSPILDRKIKIGLIGCGRIAGKHLDAISKHTENLELVDVCDHEPERAKKAANEFGATPHTELADFLEKTKSDIVTICSPSGMHPAHTIMCAEAGKHVITEKPMATRWHDGLDMVNACDESGVRLFVVKQNRHNATLQLLKQAVEKRRFGRIHMVNINVFWTRPQEYYDQDAWRGTWEFDGGAFMNQASHYIDLLDWLVGPIESLQAYTTTRERDIEVEDTGVVSVKWRSGALGSVNVTMCTYPKNFEGSITILGEKGTVRVGGVAVNEIQHWEFADSQPEDEKIKTANYETTSVYGFGHPHYYKNVIDTLRGEAEPYTDGREGLKSLEVLIGIYLSARDSKSIALPLDY